MSEVTVKLKTEEELCGDEYLENGELELVLGASDDPGLVTISGKGFRTAVYLDDLSKAVKTLEAGS